MTAAEIHADCWKEMERLSELLERYISLLYKVHHTRALSDAEFENWYDHDKEETFDYVAAGFENDAYEKWIKGDRE